MGAGDENRRAMVDQAAGVIQVDGLEMFKWLSHAPF
jgi:hypothetical protein